jgi:hypothetical protein
LEVHKLNEYEKSASIAAAFVHQEQQFMGERRECSKREEEEEEEMELKVPSCETLRMCILTTLNWGWPNERGHLHICGDFQASGMVAALAMCSEV